MKDYLWVYILGSIFIMSLATFIFSFSRDFFLIKKLKLKKKALLANFLLLVTSLASISLLIKLFILLKNQIDILS